MKVLRMKRILRLFLPSVVLWCALNVCAGEQQEIEVLYELELPSVLNRAYEVRWYDRDSLLVSSGRSWAAILDLTSRVGPKSPWVPFIVSQW